MAVEPGTPPAAGVVRPLRADDLPAAAARQRRELPEGFFTQLGERFLARYLETYLHSPVGVALVAELDGAAVGHLVGTVGPGHSRWALRYRWPRLLPPALTAMLVRPGVALTFVRTRARRYARTVGRVVRTPETARPLPAAGTASRVTGPAALLHVAVDPQARGGGVGAALVREFERQSSQAGCRTARLVTFAGDPADSATSGATEFYRRLGWQRAGERIDEAGRLVLTLTTDLPAPGDDAEQPTGSDR